jgi:SAM-dependent methyltransferase
MAFASAYTPPQATALLTTNPGKVNIYEETGGQVTAQFAAHNLSLLPEPISSGAVIHDNAAGSGTVSRALLSSPDVPKDITIHATDIDTLFLDVLQLDTESNAWPISVSNQPAQALTFADETFTHSITNIAIFLTPEAGLPAAKHIYRTLKPGGVAVVNCWEMLTWLPAFKQVHDVLRPGVPYPAPPIPWADGTQLQKVLAEAGFSREKMRVERSEAWAKTKDLRDWAEKSYAFLGGLAGWWGSEEDRWDEAVGLLVNFLKEKPTTKVVEGETWMRASQWVVVVKK